MPDRPLMWPELTAEVLDDYARRAREAKQARVAQNDPVMSSVEIEYHNARMAFRRQERERRVGLRFAKEAARLREETTQLRETIRELRETNQRLREENERFRRAVTRLF